MQYIVFYYVNDELPSYSDYFISCIRKYMPLSYVVQLTDEQTPAFNGIDSALRSKTRHPYGRNAIGYIGYQYLSEMPFNEVIFLDPDMLLNGSLEHLLYDDSEIMVATRPDGQHISKSYKQMFPYCSMMVVKNKQFWKDCYSNILKFRKHLWTNNMAAVANVIRSGRYRVKELDGNIYNQMPSRYDKNVKVYHFNVVGKDRKIELFFKEEYSVMEKERLSNKQKRQGRYTNKMRWESRRISNKALRRKARELKSK